MLGGAPKKSILAMLRKSENEEEESSASKPAEEETSAANPAQETVVSVEHPSAAGTSANLAAEAPIR